MILFGSGLQPENALKVLEKGWKLTYFSYDSSIQEWSKKAEDLLKKMNINYLETNEKIKLEKSFEQIKEEISKYIDDVDNLKNTIDEKQKEIKDIQKQLMPISHLKNISINLQDLYNLKYMNFRYGKIPIDNYEEIKNEIVKMNLTIIEAEREENFLWLIYFMPNNITDKVDSFFKVMKFERVWLPGEITGTPIEFINKVNKFIEQNNNSIERIQKQLEEYRESIGKNLLNNYYQ